MSNTAFHKKIFHFESTQFNYKCRSIIISGKIISLTKKEADILFLLCNNAPATVTYDMMRQYAWKNTYASSLSIAQVIRKLRKKVNDEDRNIIITQPKLGYRLAQKHEAEMGNHAEISNLYFEETTPEGLSELCNQVSVESKIMDVLMKQELILDKLRLLAQRNRLNTDASDCT